MPANFQLVSPFQPAGDQPRAIEQLMEGFERGKRFQTLLGATGTGKTFTAANIIQRLQRPTLVLSHNKTLAAQLYKEFKHFFPHNAVCYFVSYYDYYQPEAYIPQRDIYIEKDSSINENIDRLRLAATSALVSREDVIIVASVSCIYGLGSPTDYKRMMVTLKKGDIITLDGGAGHVYLGAVPTVSAALTGEFGELMTWADNVRTMKVRANADTPLDARTARSFGAEGIGLCRTEHMFFQPDRILAVREMILAKNEAGRRAALAKILPMQREDFIGIFREMDGLPVTIRLLDPPLHEFLPHARADLEEVAKDLGESVETIAAKVAELTESNPMLGHRGCRLAVTWPEIYETQAQAIAEAAVAAAAAGVVVLPEVMIPLVMQPGELARLRTLVVATMDRVLAGAAIPYTVGTMIELPRACLVAGSIAAHADFFSFGTNDLTQTTFGISRDDGAKFMPAYLEADLLADDPFAVLDQEGVGALIELAVARGRATKPGLKIGICGEHGGEPSSVAFCHRQGFDYVSCSPFRVPIARVAAARAALETADNRTEGQA